MFADPVLQGVRELPQLDGAVAQLVFEPGLNWDHDFLLEQDGREARQFNVKNLRTPATIRRGSPSGFYRTLTCDLHPKLLGAHVNCDFRPGRGAHPSRPPEATGDDGVSPTKQIALRAYRRLVCHCATMTSPGLVSAARANRGLVHDPFGSHQMAAWATQRRRRVADRWESNQFPDRGHRATVGAIPACGINKSDGLAEKNSARRDLATGAGFDERN